MEAREQEKLESPNTNDGEEQKEQWKIPEFTKDNITATAKEMFPGCSVLWGRSYDGGKKMTILMYGDGEPGDLCPFHIQGGNLMQIAKTLVTIFGSCQHVVMLKLSQSMSNVEDEKKQSIITPGQGNVQ